MYLRKTGFEQDLEKAQDTTLTEEEFNALLNKHHGEMSIAEALARNPACPLKMFFQFWRYGMSATQENTNLEKYKVHIHWEQGTRNSPRLSFSQWSSDVSTYEPMMFKMLYLVEHVDSAYLRHIMSIENIPEELINRFISNKSAPLRKTLASRETVPDGAFEILSKDKAKTVRTAVAENPFVASSLLAILASDSESSVAKAAQNNPACPQEAIQKARLAESTKPSLIDKNKSELSYKEITELALDAMTSAERLKEFAQHADPCIRFLIGINSSAPVETLESLANDSLEWVRASVAFNRETPQTVLAQLLISKNRDVLIGLASNSSLDEDSQLKLADIADEEICEILANLTQHVTVWEKLAENVDTKVASKKKTWRHYLAEALAARSDGKFSRLERNPKSRRLFVSRIGAGSESCPSDLLSHYAYYVFADYSQNPLAALALLEGQNHVPAISYNEWKLDKWLSEGQAPGHVSNYYINCDNEKRRLQAVGNWTTQLIYLLQRVHDSNTNARKRLAKRPDLIQFMFEMLARDEKPGVREEIARNKNTPKELLKELTCDSATIVRASVSGVADSKKQSGLVNQGSATDRARIAKATNDPAVLTELSTDRAASVRVKVLLNYETPEEVIASLANDKDVKVRATAASRCRQKEVLRKLLTDADQQVRMNASKSGIWRTYSREDGYKYDHEFFSWIADADDEEQRAIVAQYSEDEIMHRKFMKDPSVHVLRSLGRNKSFAIENKLSLARMTDDQDTLAVLADRTDNEELFLIAAEKINSSHCDDPIRCHHEMLSRPRVQDKLCNHPLPNVRYSLLHQKTLTDYASEALKDLIEERDKKQRKWINRKK